MAYRPRRKRVMLAAEAQANAWKIESNTQYLLDLGAELGFGVGVREYQFAKGIKRKFAADVAWPAIKLLVEIDGGVFSGGRHVRGQGFTRDCEKLSIAAILGYYVLRFTYPQIADGTALRLFELFAKYHITGYNKKIGGQADLK